MFEHRRAPLASRARFTRRVLRHFAFSLLVIAGSLALGMIGYHYTEHMPWLDAYLNAAMLLGGMGPVDTLHSRAGKVFAGLYALYAGMVVLVAASILIAPIFHRFLHRFHLADTQP